MPHVTDDDFTPLIQVVAWFTLAAIIFGFVARAITKAAAIRAINLDDYVIACSTILAIGQLAAVLIAARNGDGKPELTLSGAAIDGILKASYAADILYVLSLCLAKSAVLALVRTISPIREHHIIVAVLQGVLVVLGLTSVLVVAFQCNVPATWDWMYGRCIDRYAWWTFFEAANLFTDLLLILVPAYVVRNVHVPLKRKLSVVAFFGIRSSAISAILCKLVYLSRLHTVSDRTLDLWPVTIITQVIQCASIMSACALYLRPFLELLQSGFLNLDDLKRKGVMSPFTLADRDVTRGMHVQGSSSGSKSKQSSNKGRWRRHGNRISGPYPSGHQTEFEDEEADMDLHPEVSPGIYRGRTVGQSRSPSDSNGTRRWAVERQA